MEPSQIPNINRYKAALVGTKLQIQNTLLETETFTSITLLSLLIKKI